MANIFTTDISMPSLFLLSKFRTALLSLCLLISSVFISWVLLAQINFAYPVLHSIMGIDKHIEKYGPQNRYRKGFEQTNKEEQVRLFAAITHGIHNNGEGLDKLTYRDKTGRPIRTLLRKPEVIHLNDVAHLINQFYTVAGFAILLSIVLLGFYKYNHLSIPSIKQQAIGILSFSGICLISVLLIGPVKVFYALHIWIFPDNHQWFFYYQESLMTVLMKAPDLFGAIAAIIAIFGIGIYISFNLLLAKYFTQTKKMGR